MKKRTIERFQDGSWQHLSLPRGPGKTQSTNAQDAGAVESAFEKNSSFVQYDGPFEHSGQQRQVKLRNM
jgi:hypothetical protein